jgi:multidrug efflux pump subunit AcrB
MRSLIRFFIDRHLLVNMIVVATLGVGFFIVSKTQRESFPATSLNLVQITTVFPGASAGDIETKVTIPIERALRGVDGIEVTSSISSENVSAVVVELFDHFGDDEADEAVADIQAALDGIQGFPPDLENPPFVVLLDPARIPALEVFLGGPRDDVIAAANALDDILSRVDGVSEVIPLGFGDPEVHVLVQPQKARAVNVTLDEVMHAIRQKNRSETGGKLEAGVGQRQVVLAGTYDDPTEVKDTVLRFDPMGGLLRGERCRAGRTHHRRQRHARARQR